MKKMFFFVPLSTAVRVMISAWNSPADYSAEKSGLLKILIFPKWGRATLNYNHCWAFVLINPFSNYSDFALYQKRL